MLRTDLSTSTSSVCTGLIQNQQQFKHQFPTTGCKVSDTALFDPNASFF